MKKRQKTKAIILKRRRAREGLSSLNKKKDENDVRNDTDLCQTMHKYLLHL